MVPSTPQAAAWRSTTCTQTCLTAGGTSRATRPYGWWVRHHMPYVLCVEVVSGMMHGNGLAMFGWRCVEYVEAAGAGVGVCGALVPGEGVKRVVLAVLLRGCHAPLPKAFAVADN